MKTGAKCVEQTSVMGRTVTPWSFWYHRKYLTCLAASPSLPAWPVTNVHLKWYMKDQRTLHSPQHIVSDLQGSCEPMWWLSLRSCSLSIRGLYGTIWDSTESFAPISLSSCPSTRRNSRPVCYLIEEKQLAVNLAMWTPSSRQRSISTAIPSDWEGMNCEKKASLSRISCLRPEAWR